MSNSPRNIRKVAPQRNEVELSVFGPGIGECLVLHLGDGDWIIVDSCLNAVTGKPAAEDYLREIGVDLSTQVKVILVSHWHDDHVRGIARLLSLCNSAKLAMSSAFSPAEFLAIVASTREIPTIRHSSGVSEMADTLTIQAERKKSGRFLSAPDLYVGSQTKVFSNSDSQVIALTPTAQDQHDALGQFQAIAPQDGSQTKSFHCTNPNICSVALLVNAGAINFLLGADVEAGGTPSRGWKGVITSDHHGGLKSDVYKVAHHGSPICDDPTIWANLLNASPIAVLTPFARGITPRPASADITRLGKQAREVYSVVWPILQGPPKRGTVVDQATAQVLKVHQSLKSKCGHIRVRVPIGGNSTSINVQLFDDAQRVA